MSNDTGSRGYIEIMRLVNEMDAQSGRFKADVQERMTGMMQRQSNRPEKVKASDQMAATQDPKSYIASYVRTIRDSFGSGKA